MNKKLFRKAFFIFSLFIPSFGFYSNVNSAEPANTSKVSVAKPEKIQKRNIKSFENISKLFDQKKFEQIEVELQKLAEREGLNGIELTYISNYRGAVCLKLKDDECAADHFVEALRYRDSLKQGFYYQLVKQAAEVQFLIKNYDEAIKYAKEYIDNTSGTKRQVQVLLAQSHYSKQNYNEALEANEAAIWESIELLEKPKESWLNLLQQLYKHTKQPEQRRKALLLLVRYYPIKAYQDELDSLKEDSTETSNNL